MFELGSIVQIPPNWAFGPPVLILKLITNGLGPKSAEPVEILWAFGPFLFLFAMIYIKCMFDVYIMYTTFLDF